MSSGKSTRFFYIFILALVVGGVFLFLNQLGFFKDFAFFSKPLLSVEEMRILIKSDRDKRAEYLIIEKNFEEREDSSNIYYIFPKEKGWMSYKKANDQEIEIFIEKKDDYLKVKKYLDKFERDKEDKAIINVGDFTIFDMGYSRINKKYWIFLGNY